MKALLASLLVVAAIASTPATASPLSTDQTKRLAASFVLAQGRAPSSAEIQQWTQQGPLSIADLIARQRTQLQSDAATMRATAVKAWQDAFGRAPSEEEIGSWPRGANTYTELMQRHVQWLAGHPADYEKVMQRAYQYLLRREIYPLEIDYWKKQGALPYILLLACLEDWARRNQPGLMVTVGIATVSVNSEYLVTVRLSPALAAEARAAAGLSPAADATAGHNLVAAGAGNLVTGGRIHFVAAGAADPGPVRAVSEKRLD